MENNFFSDWKLFSESQIKKTKHKKKLKIFMPSNQQGKK